MANGIRIDELDATVLPSRDHVVPAMKDGLTVKLTVGQILDLLGKVLDPDEVGSKALFAALNLSDLDDPEQARENLGATEVGDALFTAASKAAGRSAIDALGPDETPDKAFRRGNIIGTVSQDGGTPTGAIIERGSNANGEYVRFADGTQICHFHGTVTNQAINTEYVSSGLFFGQRTWTFPAQFASGHIVAFHQGRWSTGMSWSTLAAVTTTTAEFRFIDANSRSTGMDFVLNFAAIGRWF